MIFHVWRARALHWWCGVQQLPRAAGCGAMTVRWMSLLPSPIISGRVTEAAIDIVFGAVAAVSEAKNLAIPVSMSQHGYIEASALSYRAAA